MVTYYDLVRGGEVAELEEVVIAVVCGERIEEQQDLCSRGRRNVEC